LGEEASSSLCLPLIRKWAMKPRQEDGGGGESRGVPPSALLVERNGFEKQYELWKKRSVEGKRRPRLVNLEQYKTRRDWKKPGDSKMARLK